MSSWRKILFSRAGTKYLLDDEFRDNRTAGAVNGTPATPGPGVRTVTDTGNRLSIGSGAANFTAGGASGDPSLWWSVQTNTPGRFVIGEVTLVNTTTVTDLGWDTAQAGGIFHGVRFNNGAVGVLSVLDGGAGSGSASYGTYAATTYKCAVILRGSGSGFYALIKGGTFTNWTLFWVSANTGVITTPYPAINTRGANNYSFLRVPAALWLPVPLAYDTFTRADGALGSSESTGPDGQAVTSRVWTNQQGTVQISGNTAIATALDGSGRAICTVPTSTADVLLDANVTKTTTGAGIVLRYQDSDNYVYMWHNGANLLFVSRAAGIETTLVNAAAAYGAGRTIRGILSGTSGSSFYNNAQIGATQVVPASAYGVHGLIFFDTDSTLDVFQTFARGTSSEFSALDRWSGTNP